MPRVFNKYHGEAPEDAVYIGRGSPWGNPFRIDYANPRDLVCDRFRDEILPGLDVSSLEGKDLVCFCKPHRCHGDDLLKKANPNMKAPNRRTVTLNLWPKED